MGLRPSNLNKEPSGSQGHPSPIQLQGKGLLPARGLKLWLMVYMAWTQLG